MLHPISTEFVAFWIGTIGVWLAIKKIRRLESLGIRCRVRKMPAIVADARFSQKGLLEFSLSSKFFNLSEVLDKTLLFLSVVFGQYIGWPGIR